MSNDKAKKKIIRIYIYSMIATNYKGGHKWKNYFVRYANYWKYVVYKWD